MMAGGSIWVSSFLVLLGTSDRGDLGEADAPGVTYRQERNALSNRTTEKGRLQVEEVTGKLPWS